MSSRTVVTCDQCTKDLSTTKGAPNYRIVLAAESIPLAAVGAAGHQMASMVHRVPPLESVHHFCNAECLCGYIRRRWPALIQAPPVDERGPDLDAKEN